MSLGSFLKGIPGVDWIAHPSHAPIIGSAFGQTPEQEALHDQIAKLEQVYGQYRPQAAQARMQGLSQRLGAFQPVNQLLGEVNGMGPGQAFFNTEQLQHNPLAPTGGQVQQQVQQAAHGFLAPFGRK